MPSSGATQFVTDQVVALRGMGRVLYAPRKGGLTLPTFWFYGRFSPGPTIQPHVPKAFGIADTYGVNLMGDAFWVALPERLGRGHGMAANW
jgi:hypothetical protein